MTNQNSQSQKPLASQEVQDLEEVQLEEVIGAGRLGNFWKCCVGGSPTNEGSSSHIPGARNPLNISHPITTIAEAPEPPSSSVPTPHGPIDPRQSRAGFVRTDSGGHISTASYNAFLMNPNRIPPQLNK